MFADLDDRTPPVATLSVRERVDVRTLALAEEHRRHRRRARVGFVAGALVLLLLIGAAVIAGRSGSSRSQGPVASTSTTIAGKVVVRWDFKGTPSTADAETTVARLTKRFADLHLPLRAELTGGQVVVVEPSDQGSAMTLPAFSRTVLDALAQPGHFEFRGVIAEQPGYVETPLTGPGIVAAYQYSHVFPPSGPDAIAGQGVVASYSLGPVRVGGSAIESASADLNQIGDWEVRPVFRLGSPGIDSFNAAAVRCFQGDGACPTKQLAMVLDGTVLAAPTVIVPSFERDQITIAAGFDQQTAREVAAMLDSGELPAPLRT
jgi:hypothetical protein